MHADILTEAAPGPTGTAPVVTRARPGTAIAAAALAIVSGWPTAVVAVDLVTGWWAGDRLFCVAVAFLALLFGAASVTGVILLLRRRAVGRYLIAFGSAVALLTFASVFIAGARVGWGVYLVPVLPLAALVLALLPPTRRWAQPDIA